MFDVTVSIQNFPGGPSHCKNQRDCRDKWLELIREFSNDTRYKINTQITTVFLNANNSQIGK